MAKSLPASVAFCDVETTGFGNQDRIVSFGGIGMTSRNVAKGQLDLKCIYLVFNPGTANGRAAERIHGFSDSALRLQDPFTVHAADVRCFLTSYELFVAHNAAFDLRFINREMSLSGLPVLNRPVYCTRKAYRALGLGGSASLNSVCRRIRLARAGDLHDAIEDAWLAMQIYLWQHGYPLQRRLRRSLPRTPSNLRQIDILMGTTCRPTPIKRRPVKLSIALTSLPWTTGEPPKHCILGEGVHEVGITLVAFIGPGR